MNSTFLFDLARCTFTRFVKLYSQTMQFSTRQTNFYTLLLFISFDTWSSTLHMNEMSILHSILTRRISPVTPSTCFKLNIAVYFQLNFWIFVYASAASVIIGRDKRSLCGGGRKATDLPPPLALRSSCFVNKGVGRQRTTFWPQSKMLLALLKRKALFAAKEGFKVV